MCFDCRLGIPFGTHQLRDLEEYSHRVKSLNLLIDMKEHVDSLNKTMGHYNILIKVDTGYHRAGLDAAKPDAIVALAKYVQDSSVCHFLGIYSHAGHSYNQKSKEDVCRVAREERDAMVRVRKELERNGIKVAVVSCGSTPACTLSDDWTGVTEIHAGNYCCFDRWFYRIWLIDRNQVDIGSCESTDVNAGRLLCRVLSHYPERNTMLTDGGGIPLSKDKSGLDNWGTVYGHPELYISR